MKLSPPDKKFLKNYKAGYTDLFITIYPSKPVEYPTESIRKVLDKMISDFINLFLKENLKKNTVGRVVPIAWFKLKDTNYLGKIEIYGYDLDPNEFLKFGVELYKQMVESSREYLLEAVSKLGYAGIAGIGIKLKLRSFLLQFGIPTELDNIVVRVVNDLPPLEELVHKFA